MTLKHPAARRRAADELAVAPLFSLETETIPRQPAPVHGERTASSFTH